jgi:hypothetical protein
MSSEHAESEGRKRLDGVHSRSFKGPERRKRSAPHDEINEQAPIRSRLDTVHQPSPLVKLLENANEETWARLIQLLDRPSDQNLLTKHHNHFAGFPTQGESWLPVIRNSSPEVAHALPGSVLHNWDGPQNDELPSFGVKENEDREPENEYVGSQQIPNTNLDAFHNDQFDLAPPSADLARDVSLQGSTSTDFVGQPQNFQIPFHQPSNDAINGRPQTSQSNIDTSLVSGFGPHISFPAEAHPSVQGQPLPLESFAQQPISANDQFKLGSYRLLHDGVPSSFHFQRPVVLSGTHQDQTTAYPVPPKTRYKAVRIRPQGEMPPALDARLRTEDQTMIHQWNQDQFLLSGREQATIHPRSPRSIHPATQYASNSGAIRGTDYRLPNEDSTWSPNSVDPHIPASHGSAAIRQDRTPNSNEHPEQQQSSLDQETVPTITHQQVRQLCSWIQAGTSRKVEQFFETYPASTANFNCPRSQRTIFALMIEKDYPGRFIKKLAQNGADPCMKDVDGTVFLTAVKHKLELAVIAKSQACLDTPDANGRTAMWWKIETVCTKFFMKSKYVPLQWFFHQVNTGDTTGTTPLMIAVKHLEPQVVRKLLFPKFLGLKADPNQRDKEGRTALMYLEYGGRKMMRKKSFKIIINSLLEAGADPTIKDVMGKSAQQYAPDEYQGFFSE